MKTIMFALAAAASLPASSVVSAQAPAPLDLESVQPIAGIWSYRTVAGGSEADFIDGTAAVRLKISCNRAARTVSIARTGVPAAAATLSIWTTSLSRSVPARFLATKDLIADLSASYPLLDSIAFSRGRIATGAAGAAMVAVPSSPETARVIEDCRS
jgi:hypothetical protein